MTQKSRIYKDNQGHYYITCAMCGKKSVSFGVPQVIFDEGFVAAVGQDCFLYQGLLISQCIPEAFVDEVKKILDAGDLKSLNSYLVEKCNFTEGMDAYCYKCNCVYCREHYNIEIVFDEVFYDCAYGTCPHKHFRKIDE